MNSKLSHILALSGEAALFVEQGRIVYGNAGAERLLGPCLGRQAAELLGAEYSAAHARAFVLSTQLQGAPYLLRVNRLEAGRLVFLQKQEEAPIILNDPFLYSLRSNLKYRLLQKLSQRLNQRQNLLRRSRPRLLSRTINLVRKGRGYREDSSLLHLCSIRLRHRQRKMQRSRLLSQNHRSQNHRISQDHKSSSQGLRSNRNLARKGLRKKLRSMNLRVL